jgi:hypothetical protein
VRGCAQGIGGKRITCQLLAVHNPALFALLHVLFVLETTRSLVPETYQGPSLERAQEAIARESTSLYARLSRVSVWR